MTLSNTLSRVTAYGWSNPYSHAWKETTDRAATARRPSSPAARLVRSDGAIPRGYPRRFAEAWLGRVLSLLRDALSLCSSADHRPRSSLIAAAASGCTGKGV